VDERRSRPVRPAVRCALAVSMAVVAVGSAWQGVSAKSTTSAVASAARGHHKVGHHHAQATEADNMKSVTLRRGDTLTVTLHGGWSTPTSSNSTVLRDSGMKSTTSATFTADTRGTATVEARRAPDCPPGRMCPMYMQIYRLDVTVTR
jgi:hypothetical protein